MPDSNDKLKLGMGAAFVKTCFCRLRQEDDTWEADFFPIPCSDSEYGSMWMGMVMFQEASLPLRRADSSKVSDRTQARRQEVMLPRT